MTTFLVCAPVGNFADDVQAACEQCGAAIVHRPHAPPDSTKVCIACAVTALSDACTEGRRPEIAVTPATLREVALYRAKTRGTQ